MSYSSWASYRRKLIDQYLEEATHLFKGRVLDIGGRDRGKFQKPRDKVEAWIHFDINEDHNPDIVGDVQHMDSIKDESYDVVLAAELFEHVPHPDKALAECHRILTKDGLLIITVPFLHPVHADPSDYIRWTEHKWLAEFDKLGFTVQEKKIMGGFFTVLGDMLKDYINVTSKYPRKILKRTYPLIDKMTRLDQKKIAQKGKLPNYHGGYFFVINKS
jgi:predicted SAM-dependent methyltransferase